MRANAYAAVVDRNSAMTADSVAIFTEFHSQRSTGRSGSTRRPSGPTAGMPSAKRQCSRLIDSGMMLPVAKLPGRSEIDRIIKYGKITSTHRQIRNTCAATTRQRWLLSMTMAISASPLRRCA
jgi:hypothetical protein